MIFDAEAEAAMAGVSVQELCRRAGLNRATWQRWKAGTVGPTLANWQRVQAVIDSLHTTPTTEE